MSNGLNAQVRNSNSLKDEKLPKVTVVTVTYNLLESGREKVFRQCIESVHNQTYKNIEHIIIDGASDDGTLELLEEYKQLGWIKYYSEPDDGIYEAMNKGIRKSDGKYIAFLNSDDFYHDNKGIEDSLIALEKNNADFSYAPVKMVDKEGKLANLHPHKIPQMSIVFVEMPFGHQSMLTKKSVFEDIGLFDEKYKSASDYEFIIRLALNEHKGIEVARKFATFRTGGFSEDNWGKSVNEISDFFCKHYGEFYPLTKEAAKQIYLTKKMPKKLEKKLKPYIADYKKTEMNCRIKVGFLNYFSSDWMGGINYYKNLFMAMEKVEGPKIHPYIFKPQDPMAESLLDYSSLSTSKGKKDLKYRLVKLWHALLNKPFDKNVYLNKDLDVDVISHVQTGVSQSPKIPTISWISDFQHIHLPELFSEEELKYRNEIFASMAKYSQIVLFSSENALNDFKNFAPEYVSKGRVLHFVAIPDDSIYEKTDEIKAQVIEKYDLPSRYFYVPNQFWIHKNHKVVFEAVSILKKQGIDINIVFTGNTNDYRNPNHFNDLMNFAKENNMEKNVKVLGLVDLIEVYYLMRNCVSIINPSFFEGWSSTVEEAKSLGKNIILSSLNVHKEQNPPQGVYFDPKNPQELAEILKKKWESGTFGPDYELEKQAREKLEGRIEEFGKEYQKIIMEVLQK